LTTNCEVYISNKGKEHFKIIRKCTREALNTVMLGTAYWLPVSRI